MYMQTCCTHRIYNHSVVNVCGMSGELQVSNNENVFKCPSSWSGKYPEYTDTGYINPSKTEYKI